ncbi:hypothetical protein VB779_09835 [Haloarculaceae archaeon H-GB11]|nr:hypothetical protein [Haloarculaceae archaeon H-GB11]
MGSLVWAKVGALAIGLLVRSVRPADGTAVALGLLTPWALAVAGNVRLLAGA